MKLAYFASGWWRLLRTLALVIIGVILIQPLLPQSSRPAEPLADPESLSLLLNRNRLPKPPEEYTGEFHGAAVRPPALTQLVQGSGVLGTTSVNEKRVEVDLTHQRVWAFEGGEKIYDFVVSTGKWAPTPTGEFVIWAKVKSQKMSGGNKALGTYYYLPNVPWVMFFYNQEIAKMRGFSLHGTYWHDNFGHPMSHGCINMKIPDAKTLYDWIDPPVTDPRAWSTLASAENPGTRVIIYGQTPQE